MDVTTVRRDQPGHEALFLQAISRDSGVAEIQGKKKALIIPAMGFGLEIVIKSYFIPFICYNYVDYFQFLIRSCIRKTGNFENVVWRYTMR